MLATIFIASPHTADIATLVIGETLSTFVVYMGIFGDLRPRGSYRVLRIAVRTAFIIIGGFFFWEAIRELHEQGYGDLIATVTFVVTAASLTLRNVIAWHRYAGWRSWPVAEGTVQQAKVEEIRSGHSHYFVAELGYSYVVGGEYYSGLIARDFVAEADAWQYANLVRGATTFVRYHPQHHERSRLYETRAR